MVPPGADILIAQIGCSMRQRPRHSSVSIVVESGIIVHNAGETENGCACTLTPLIEVGITTWTRTVLRHARDSTVKVVVTGPGRDLDRLPLPEVVLPCMQEVEVFLFTQHHLAVPLYSCPCLTA